jgi:RHS repeat-associated protein
VNVYAYSNASSNGSCVGSAEGIVVPQGPGLPANYYLGAAYAPIIYDAYGLPVWTPPTIPSSVQRLNWATAQPFQYKGQYGYFTDSTTGLVYCQKRYYDPNVGRWTSRDPTGLDGGVNVYSYCDGDPVQGADPSGLDPQAFYSLMGIGPRHAIVAGDTTGWAMPLTPVFWGLFETRKPLTLRCRNAAKGTIIGSISRHQTKPFGRISV